MRWPKNILRYHNKYFFRFSKASAVYLSPSFYPFKIPIKAYSSIRLFETIVFHIITGYNDDNKKNMAKYSVIF